MSQPNPSTAMARSLIDELARGGVELVAISPGSRSTALALAAVAHPTIETRVVLDERSAAFHALGRAKVTGDPTAVICTSGTAPANYLPAVVEADLSLTPLIVLSADRPVEMRGVGANQTIDQVDLYGDRVRLFTDVPAPSETDDLNEEWREIAAASVSASLGMSDRPGPVHINLAFREPTVPLSDDGRSVLSSYPFEIEGRKGGERWQVGAVAASESGRAALDYHANGLVLAGEGLYDCERLIEVADGLGWPVLATAQSGVRDERVISAYHHVLAGGVPDLLWPDLVYAVGAIGPSQRLEELIAKASVRVRVDSWGRSIDPNRNATHVIRADPVATLFRIDTSHLVDLSWRDRWKRADRDARAAASRLLEQSKSPSGPAIAQAMGDVDWEVLVVASSLAIRDIDAHLGRSGTVVANRGASGIDGFVSTALGVSSTGLRTVAVTGDLSLLHDSNGFLYDRSDDLVIVVIDNNGGGLFDALPQASHASDFERLFVAPQGRDLAQLAKFHDLAYTDVDHVSDLSKIVGDQLGSPGISLIRVGVDRSHDLEMRQRLDEVGRSLFEA
jgi:2-succinyl-5-enolpyruvyl-6-hydroxy-3-cyclohexene-1-carboxylate synthase